MLEYKYIRVYSALWLSRKSCLSNLHYPSHFVLDIHMYFNFLFQKETFTYEDRGLLYINMYAHVLHILCSPNVSLSHAVCPLAICHCHPYPVAHCLTGPAVTFLQWWHPGRIFAGFQCFFRQFAYFSNTFRPL